MSADTGLLSPSLGRAGGIDWSRVGAVTLRWVAAILAALAIFSVLLVAKGANPLAVFTDMWASTFARPKSVAEIFIKMAPFVLAALAVVVPAKAGLTNVGGEGQVIVGGVAAAGTGLLLDPVLPGGAVFVIMIIAGMLAGAAWAGIAATLRLFVKVNEAVSTLLLNFVALDLLLFLIYQPWRESSTGQPSTRELADTAKIPVITGTGVNIGIILALVATAAVFFVLNFTRWGFRLGVVGGNPEAARRAGMPVASLLLTALLVGGALAGLAGVISFAGTEYKLRPSFGDQIGYVGFLVSWLAAHKPIPVLIAAFVFAALAVGGDSLQLDSHLPAATVNILTALILVAVLGWTRSKEKAL
ncbi:ABC transporter permease [soil metagenome]